MRPECEDAATVPEAQGAGVRYHIIDSSDISLYDTQLTRLSMMNRMNKILLRWCSSDSLRSHRENGPSVPLSQHTNVNRFRIAIEITFKSTFELLHRPFGYSNPAKFISKLAERNPKQRKCDVLKLPRLRTNSPDVKSNVQRLYNGCTTNMLPKFWWIFSYRIQVRIVSKEQYMLCFLSPSIARRYLACITCKLKLSCTFGKAS